MNKRVKFEENKTEVSGDKYYWRKWYEFWKPRFTRDPYNYTYYEYANDTKGEPLKIGDNVEIINNFRGQFDGSLINKKGKIIGIVQGDLMLDIVSYCWPEQVVKSAIKDTKV